MSFFRFTGIPPMKGDRARIRRELRALRRAIAPTERIACAQSLAQRLLSLPSAPRHGLVAGYWAVDGEIALHAWQMQLPAGLTYCLPLLGDDGRLVFAPWRPGDALTTNRFGIPEPEVAPEYALAPDAMAMVVTPLVAFDARCQRLGMGGGWYDRSFAAARASYHGPAPRGTPMLIGAAFAAQQVDSVPTASWDVALHAVCTDQQIFHRTSGQ